MFCGREVANNNYQCYFYLLITKNELMLVLNPTLKCNFRCVYCYEDHINSSFDDNIMKLNSLVKCEGGTPKAITIYPNGQTTFCSMAAEEGYFYGEIKDGEINIKNKALYYNFHNDSIFNNDMCVKCEQLPICMGHCMLSRFKNKGKCTRKNGLSLNEKIKLHYISDFYKDRIV